MMMIDDTKYDNIYFLSFCLLCLFLLFENVYSVCLRGRLRLRATGTMASATLVSCNYDYQQKCHRRQFLLSVVQ